MSSTAHNHEHFISSYAGQAPWDIGKVQPAFEQAADKIVGSVLDAGCGTGENALFLASRGHVVTGFDFVEEPIARAKRKASERGLSATFLAVGMTLAMRKPTDRMHVGSEGSSSLHCVGAPSRRSPIPGPLRLRH